MSAIASVLVRRSRIVAHQHSKIAVRSSSSAAAQLVQPPSTHSQKPKSRSRSAPRPVDPFADPGIAVQEHAFQRTIGKNSQSSTHVGDKPLIESIIPPSISHFHTKNSSRIQPIRIDQVLSIPELFPSAERIELPPQKMIEPAFGANFMDTKAVRALSVAKIEERMALVYASLKSGDVDRAESIFNRCWRSNPIQVRSSIDTSFVNLFIDQYLHLQRSNATDSVFQNMNPMSRLSFMNHAAHEQRALNWLRRLSEFSLKPNAATYAILCHHFLKTGNIDRVRSFVTEFEKHGSPATTLLDHDRFSSDEERRPFVALLRDMGKMPVDANTSSVESASSRTDEPDLDSAMDSLLMSAMEDSSPPSSMSRKPVSKSPKKPESKQSDAKPDSVEATLASESDLDDPTASLLDAIRVNDANQESDQKNNFDDQFVGISEAIRRERTAALASTGTSNVTILSRTLASMNDIGDMDRYQQQLWLEERAYAASIEQHEAFIKSLPQKLRRDMLVPTDLMRTWTDKLIPLIKHEINVYKETNAVTPDADSILPFLNLVAPEKLASITVREILKSPWTNRDVINDTKSYVRAIGLVSNIGSAVEHEHNFETMSNKSNKKVIKSEMGIHKLHMQGRLFDLEVRKIAEEITKRNIKLQKEWKPKWGTAVRAKIGTFLVELVVKIATIDVKMIDPDDPTKTIVTSVPAFTHKLVKNGLKTIGVFESHPALLETLSNNSAYIHPVHLPMLVKPKPWLTANSGGYLQTRTEIMRVSSNPEHKDYLMAADEANHLTLVLRALDALGSTAWQVNAPVYRVAAEFWNKGIHAPSMPKILDTTPPTPPTDLDTNPASKRTYTSLLKKHRIAQSNNYSIRCDVNYKLEIAKHFLGETMYFPHNLDFRGRAYPMPPHLHHMGNDLCRGLLTFRERRVLGESGLRWLKIQVSNLAGMDKVSMEERVSFAESHRDDIMDSALNPVNGNRWWLKSDCPWQLLATCMELAAAWQHPNPVEFESSLPIHQDGSCNGLQHYAALGGDVRGAVAVNLRPSDRPQDVYRSVADQVQVFVDKDAESGHEMARLMKHRITRKLVKQTVMTNTYGVTFIGARQQVRNRLREARVTESPDTALTDTQIEHCSMYITQLIFKSLGTIFEGARKIQVWLNKSARVVAKSIPAEEIPESQLRDSEQLAKMGLLPSPLTVVSAEEHVDAHEIEEIGEVNGCEHLDEYFDEHLDEHINDHVDGDEVSDLFESVVADTTNSSQQTPEEDTSVDQQWNNGLAQKKPIRIKPKPDAMPANMTTVIWTTPLGLPVVQPYRTQKTTTINTSLQSFSIKNDEPSPVDPQRQSSAFPPNFVHSLDASHMMLTAIACQSHNIEFAAVHDSYWTHASTVNDMNRILREAFIRLHSEHIMSRLRSELVSRYTNNKIGVQVRITDPDKLDEWYRYESSLGRKPVKRKTRVVMAWVDLVLEDVPEKGEFDVNEVRDSTYFFH